VTGTNPPPIAALAPADPHVTAYDLAHVTLYLRLLDAAAAAAPWDQVTRIVLGLDASADEHGARRTYESHLDRARWLSANGFRELLKPSST